MSDHIPLTVELLVKELKDLTNWYVFGVALGIPISKLDSIKKEYSDVEEQKVKIFQFWLQYKLDASWKMVIQALEQNNCLVLAATLSRKYLLPNTCEKEQEGSTSREANERVTAEIRATAIVVERLRDLETSFTNMLTDLLGLLNECKCDFSKAQFFLDDRFDTEKFSRCTNFNTLLRQLRRDHVDTFNTYYLQQLIAYFKKDQLTERIKEYEAEKEAFLNDTTVIEFQRAVVSRVEPVVPSQMKYLTIKISKKLAEKRTLKDMEELALRGFGEYQSEFICIQVKPGSVIVLWLYREALSGKLEHLAYENEAVFKEAGVEEVTVDRRVAFSWTPMENVPAASLKEIYTDVYRHLVEAVSDEHTCQSLLAQLKSSALISEEKIVQLSISKVTGSSFLKTLGLEEDPHLLVPLVSAMSQVEQLQTLAEMISTILKQRTYKMATVERQVFQKHYSSLHTGLQYSVDDILPLMKDHSLLPKAVIMNASSPGMLATDKLTLILDALETQIEIDGQAFHTFLNEVLAKKSHLLKLYHQMSFSYRQILLVQQKPTTTTDWPVPADQFEYPTCSRDSGILSQRSTELNSARSTQLDPESPSSVTRQAKIKELGREIELDIEMEREMAMVKEIQFKLTEKYKLKKDLKQIQARYQQLERRYHLAMEQATREKTTLKSELRQLKTALSFVERKCKEYEEGDYYKTTERQAEKLRKEMEQAKREKATLESELRQQYMYFEEMKEYGQKLKNIIIRERQEKEELRKMNAALKKTNEQLENALSLAPTEDTTTKTSS